MHAWGWPLKCQRWPGLTAVTSKFAVSVWQTRLGSTTALSYHVRSEQDRALRIRFLPSSVIVGSCEEALVGQNAPLSGAALPVLSLFAADGPNHTTNSPRSTRSPSDARTILPQRLHRHDSSDRAPPPPWHRSGVGGSVDLRRVCIRYVIANEQLRREVESKHSPLVGLAIACAWLSAPRPKYAPRPAAPLVVLRETPLVGIPAHTVRRE